MNFDFKFNSEIEDDFQVPENNRFEKEIEKLFFVIGEDYFQIIKVQDITRWN